MRLLFYISIILTIASCSFGVPDFATAEQKRQAMQNASFDKGVIQNLDRYAYFKSFLEKNIDTIIKFRFNRNTATLIRGQGQSDSNYLADDNCYNFFQGNPRYDISNVPDFLKNKLDSIFISFGDNNIRSFEVCKDNKIEIVIKSEWRGNGLSIFHSLLWNTKIERDYAYIDNKDTLIDKKCIYRIGLLEDHGH